MFAPWFQEPGPHKRLQIAPRDALAHICEFSIGRIAESEAERAVEQGGRHSFRQAQSRHHFFQHGPAALRLLGSPQHDLGLPIVRSQHELDPGLRIPFRVPAPLPDLDEGPVVRLCVVAQVFLDAKKGDATMPSRARTIV